MQEVQLGASMLQHCPVGTRMPMITLRAIKKKREKKQSIARAVDVFVCIDPRFREIDSVSEKSRAIRIFFCDQQYNGSCPCFANPLHNREQMFGTQAQVVELARIYGSRLPSRGYTLWVPFRVHWQRLVAGIYFQNGDDQPSVRLQEISRDDELHLPNGLSSLAIFRPDLVPAS